MPVDVISEGKIIAFAEQSLLSKDALLKCLYWYGDKFHTTIDVINTTYRVTLTPLSGNVSEGDLPVYLHKLKRDFIDFQLRDMISKETQNIRDLLVAKAFSNGEFDELPQGDVADPVGFNPYLND